MRMIRIANFYCYPKVLHMILGVLLFGTVCYVFQFNSYFASLPVEKKMTTAEGLRIKGKQFTLKQKPFRILSGALHYFRVPSSEWDDRLLKMKSMGLNAIDIYIPWNLHEPIPGKFDFKGDKNIRAFLNMVETYGLYAILRPGPYICSEWDLGGLPSWLLRDDSMKLRSNYPPYLDAVKNYFNKLLPMLAEKQFSQGGPIIAFQIENEYGSYSSNDVEHMKTLKKMFEDHGLVEIFFMCDNEEGLGAYKIDGVLQTVNFMSKGAKKCMDKLESLQPDKPIFVTEFWDGWFDHWGEKHNKVDEDTLAETLKYMLKNRAASVNFYMWHGGTTFGFMNGANADDDGSNYQSDVTSYDYNAPVSEAGTVRSKYEKFMSVMQENAQDSVPSNLPWVPEDNGFSAYGNIELKEYITFNDLLSPDLAKGIERQDVCSMELLPINDGAGQSYGYIAYETQLTTSGKQLHISNARDFVLVLLNGQLIFTGTKDIEKMIVIEVDGRIKPGVFNTLVILVENRGRVNYGKDLNNQRKGILGEVILDSTKVLNWKMYPLEFNYEWTTSVAADTKHWKTFNAGDELKTPTLFKGNLFLESFPKDTIISLPGWFKGVVFVNGRNLGRYWHIGPQRTLFVPRQWLTMRNNTVLLFDLHGLPSQDMKSSPYAISTDKHDIGEDEAKSYLI